MTSEQHEQLSRRQVFKIGGMTVSLAALVAACGEDRSGDTAPGRVGNAPTVPVLPDYAVNDAVLLRTASSLENTAVFVYETAEGLGVLGDEVPPLIAQIVQNHRDTSALMGELTEAAGGQAWTGTNPWMMDRMIEPMIALIADSDDPARDVVNLAITLENIASATHQSLTTLMTTQEQRLAVAGASVQEARHAAAIVLDNFGIARRASPVLTGGEVVNVNSIIPRYAVESKFGVTAQQEIYVGQADENGVRRSFLVPTPAANSFIYEELDDA